MCRDGFGLGGAGLSKIEPEWIYRFLAEGVKQIITGTSHEFRVQIE